MTFSIVATDPEKKELGFAIASCFWNAGQVGLAQAGKGAIVSQAQGNWDFIPAFFEKLDKGLTLEDILDQFRESDDNFENRQVGMVTADGKSLSFTGEKVFSAHQRIGPNYACQGNILVGPKTIDAMAYAFENTEGTLTRRLYTSLQAGDDAGGEMRGKMSARVYVVRVWDNPVPINDYTIEDHPEPVREIGRLMELKNNIITAWQLTEAVSKSDDKRTAIQELEQFLVDKEDRAFLDFHQSLAEFYLEIGEREKAVERYRIFTNISPRMITTLDGALRDAVLNS